MSITKLHTPLTKITLALFTAASSLVLSSCQDEDYGFTTDEVRASVYKRNFEGTYGEIDPNQTWDFSSYNLRKLGLAGGPSTETRAGGALTRAAINGLVEKYDNTGKWYTVSAETTDWLNSHLKEKENNTKYVSSFDWEKVENADPLYVIPIYQGQTGMIWDLELVDLDNQTSSIIWSKSENIQYEQNYAQWDEFFYESYNDNEVPYKGSKLGSVLFKNPLADVPADYTSKNDILAAFNVSKDYDVVGSFYITVGENKRIIVNGTDFPEFFAQASVDNVLENDKFKFTSNGNFELGVDNKGDRYLCSLSPNKVYLNKLLGKEITVEGTAYTISVADLKTLEFVIDDNFYPKDLDDNFDHYYTFYTWSPERIRVFVKYYGASSRTINLNNANNQYTEHHTINKYKVQTRPIKIDINQLSGTRFAFNLKTKYRGDGDKDLSDIGDDHRSDKGFMSQINHFADESPVAVTSLKDALSEFGIDLGTGTFEYMVIGCEDAGANGKNSDQDYNDLVLLLVGKTLPTQTIRKRYMIEDLGSTLDFDFNDIVVDVTERVARTSAGKTYTQTAAIRHLRGTIPFRIKIGELGTFGFGENNGKIMRGHNSGDTDYDPSLVDAIKENYTWVHEEIIDTDTKLASLRSNYWNPDENNIHVEVWPTYNSENGTLSDVFWDKDIATDVNNAGATGNNVQMRQIVEFPKTGTVPYIIATDQSVQWMAENISIPEFWIATRPEHFNNGFNQSDKTEDNIPAGSQLRPEGNKINNTTSISAGVITLSDTRKEISSSSTVSISAEAFRDVYQGDYIIVHVDGDEVYDKSRLDFKTGAGAAITSIGTSGSIVVTGDYKINVSSQDFLSTLQSSGLQIGGQYVTVTGVTVQSAGGAKVSKTNTIIESAFKLSDQRTIIRSYSDGVRLNNSDLQKLYVGDKIVVHVDNLRAESKLGFKKNTSGWPNINYHGGLGTIESGNISVTSDVVLEVNADNISDIKNGSGLVINGQYVTIKSVDIQNAIDNSTPLNQGSIKLDESTHVITSYSNVFTISAEKFRYLGGGDKIIFHVSSLRNNGSNSQSVLGVHFDYENPENNNKRDNVPGFVDNEYGNIFGVTKDVELTITNDNIGKMQQYGLFINGVNITVDAVTVVPSQNLLWNDASGLSVETNKAFDKFAYGGQSKLFNVLPSSGSVKLRFYFKEPVSGNITFFTPYSGVDQSGALIGGWTEFNPSRKDNLNNYGYYDITFNQDEIGLIKSRGGLILQNNNIDNFAVVAVRKM